MVAALERVLAEGVDLIQVEQPQMYHYAPPAPRPPLLLVEPDVLIRRDLRARSASGADRYIDLGGRRARRHEREALRSAEMVVVTCEEDRLAAAAAGARQVRVVPNGARPDLLDIPPGGAERLLFVGWGGHTPNRDALAWWIEEVVPELPEGTVLQVAGAGWEGFLDHPGLRFHGFVEDLRRLLAGALVVVPLRVGGGTKLKMIDAMAAGRAIVTTPVGAEGLPLRDGVEALIRDTATGIASAIRLIQDDAHLRQALGSAARDAVQPLLWPRIAKRMGDVYAEMEATHVRLRG
jgi:glycosyltransferase involved in cell wall biosynthesis